MDPPPCTVTVAIRDSKDYVRVLFYSYYTTITGWGVLLVYIHAPPQLLNISSMGI